MNTMAASTEAPEGGYYPKFDHLSWTRSCDQEMEVPAEGKITGEIPSWLRGTLLRNGPGSFKVGDMEFQHIFDGSALLHKFEISEGRATYLCRFLRSETYKRNHKANCIVVTEFATESVPDPCHNIFDKVAARFDRDQMITDNATVSVYPFGDEVYALTESPIIHRIDPTTLDSLDRKNLMNKYIASHTSHPHVMPNGDVYNVGLSMSLKVKHVVMKFPYREKGDMFEEAEIVGSMSPRWPFNPAYMHTFGITDNYFVIVEQPLALFLPGLMVNQIRNKPMSPCMKWHEGYDTQIVLICRKSGEEVKRYVTPAFYFAHIVNTFERNGSLFVDIITYHDSQVLNGMYIESLKNMQTNPNYADWFRSRPKRIECPLDAPNLTHVEPTLLVDLGCEMPRINYELCNGKPYRYFYGMSSDAVDTKYPGGLIKVDTETGEVKTWSEEGFIANEPVFVAAPDAKSEDDGVLLSTVLSTQNWRSVSLIVLDARTMQERARAVFETLSDVPRCIHGWFFPA